MPSDEKALPLSAEETTKLRVIVLPGTGDWRIGTEHVCAGSLRPLTREECDRLLATLAARDAETERLRDRFRLAERLLRDVVIAGGSGSWTEEEMSRWACDYKDWSNGAGLEFVERLGHRNCKHIGGGRALGEGK